MQVKHSYLTLILLLGFGAPAQAQVEPGPLDGVQSSVNQFIEGAAEAFESLKQAYDEYIRLGMLMDSDIRMSMNAEFEGDSFGVFGLFNSWSTEREGSLYAEFDWQNLAESMHVRSSASEAGISSMLLNLGDTREVPAKDFMMYIDSQGLWYVPTKDGTYIRVDLARQMQQMAKTLQVGIEMAIEAKAAQMLDQLAVLALMELPDGADSWLNEFVPVEVLTTAYSLASPGTSITEEALKPLLKNLAEFRARKVEAFPAFIHFAFLISPAAARSHFNVSEETVTWRGQDGCTRMTVVSGKDAGYQVVFDRHGRLIHLRDTAGDTADYWYDRDVTVTLPPAMDMNTSFLKGILN
jgi:hypothetical protein